MSLPIRKSALLAWAGALVLGVVICLAIFGRRSNPKIEAHGPDSQPVSQPATVPVSKPAKAPEPKYVTTLMDVVHSTFPGFPVTQPLAVPLNLSEAARLVIKDPVYFDAPGSLIWITRPDAPPTDLLLKKRPEDPERVVLTRERIVCVHWLPDGGGTYWPFLIVSADTSANGFGFLSHFGRRKIGSRTDYRWERALAWYEKLVVPTATGVSIFRFALDADGRPEYSPGGPVPIEEYQDLTDAGATTMPTAPVTAKGDYAEPQILLDWQGLLAFIPWDPGKLGGRGAARFLNDKWMPLGSSAGWPEHLLHLIPLLDGSVMQFVLTKPSEDDSDEKATLAKADDDPHAWPVKLGVVNLDHAAIDAKAIRVLVAKLGDEDQAVRDKAFNDLTRYGPAICPILKDLYDDAAPEAQARMKQLLRNQAAPLLGGMSLLGSDLHLVCRNADGSAIFYTEKGVQTGGSDADPVITAPAWLAVRPGHPVELLPPILVADLKPQKAHILPVLDEWIVNSDVRGPRRFIGNGFVNLLKKDESAFSQVIAEDHRGRWLFRKPVTIAAKNIGTQAPETSPTTTPETALATVPDTQPGSQPATAPSQAFVTVAEPGESVETLIVDPTLPNLIPRLPVWNYTTADEVGWDRDNWPAVLQLGNVSHLTETGWEVIGANNPLLSKPEQVPAIPGPPATQPAIVLPIFQLPGTPATAAGPSTEASTKPIAAIAPATTSATTAATTSATTAATIPSTEPAATTEPAEQPLWVDRDGTRYFNGIDELRIVSVTGSVVTWTLPASATGRGPAHLVKTDDGRLFLFNEPGRVLRIKPTPDGADPFIIEATLTRNIPNVERPARIWLDPAGRIIIAHDKSLAILFPAGYLPPKIRELMSDVDDDDESK